MDVLGCFFVFGHFSGIFWDILEDNSGLFRDVLGTF